ncbi:MAG: 50S ribosomal protein L29 [Candidatus Levyibacteriota bacterium]
MKKTDKQTLQTKSTIELQKLVEETYNTLGQLKLDNVQNKLKNTRSIFHTRKEIAIMQSILHMKLKTKEGEK